ncbi:hypothetical protein BD779DRAFT_1669650 [Infundibulicybe gibba]|nr:hypothetical protein BD779DRAFT_1669650 [Infundibulicybe gibba]
MSFKRLPPEIWTKIASFIPPETLRTLYSLNRFFFEVAMNERYVTLDLNNWSEHVAYVLQGVASDPSLGLRVRMFHIAPHLIQHGPLIKDLPFSLSSPALPTDGRGYSHHKSTFYKRVARMARYITRKDTTPPRLSKPPSQMVINAMKNLTSIQTYSITLEIPGSNETYPYIKDAWQIFGPTIRNLTIYTALKSFPAVIPPPPILCENLEVLCIEIPSSRVDIASGDLTAVSDFIKSYQPTLQRLTIEMCLEHDLGSFYSELGFFERLHSIDIRIPPGPALSTVIDFFNRHGEKIRHLGLLIQLTHGAQLLDFRFSEIRTPHLTSLSINSSVLSANWAESGPFLAKVCSSLTSMSIFGFISFDDLKILLGFLSPQNCLTSLSFVCRLVLAELFEFMAPKLPALQSLCLQTYGILQFAHNFVDYPPPGQPLPAAFVQEMRDVSITDWQLSNIRITHRERILWGLMVLLAECVPAINSFNDSGETTTPDLY